jgi:hypothetical protein
MIMGFLCRTGYVVKRVESLQDVMVKTTINKKIYISLMPNTIERNCKDPREDPG